MNGEAINYNLKANCTMDEKPRNGNLGIGGNLVDDTQCTFVTMPLRQDHLKFLQDGLDILLNDVVFQGSCHETKVVRWTPPDKMPAMIDFKLRKEGESHGKLLDYLRKVIRYSVQTGHPHFMNQLYSGRDPYALLGQWASTSLNAAPYTYEMAPVFTWMESTTLEEMRKLVGFESGDGVFAPGGSVAVMYAINCARFHLAPDVKMRGMCGQKRMVVFASEDAHYSVIKAAALLGIGVDNVVLVECNDKGQMIVAQLELKILQCLEEDCVPIMVCATSGTTVLGAFDPLRPIADICVKHKIWFHVDASWGGSVVVSEKHRHLVDGIEMADSVAWNPHKLLGVPLQCSVLLVKDSSILQQCHQASAQYLFQKDKFYDVRYDTGDKYLQCGRNADVLKLWFMWKAKGTDGLGQHVDRVFELAEHCADKVESTEGFRMVLQHRPQFLNVCFWYVPPRLRSLEQSVDINQELHKVAPQIKEKMMKQGSMMIGYQPLRSYPNFFRFVVQNSGVTTSDIDFIIGNICQLGQDL